MRYKKICKRQALHMNDGITRPRTVHLYILDHAARPANSSFGDYEAHSNGVRKASPVVLSTSLRTRHPDLTLAIAAPGDLPMEISFSGAMYHLRSNSMANTVLCLGKSYSRGMSIAGKNMTFLYTLPKAIRMGYRAHPCTHIYYVSLKGKRR